MEDDYIHIIIYILVVNYDTHLTYLTNTGHGSEKRRKIWFNIVKEYLTIYYACQINFPQLVDILCCGKNEYSTFITF